MVFAQSEEKEAKNIIIVELEIYNYMQRSQIDGNYLKLRLV